MLTAQGSSRIVLFLGVLWSLLFCWPALARQQGVAPGGGAGPVAQQVWTVRVVPDTGDAPEVLLAPGAVIRLPGEIWGPFTLHLKAYALLNGEIVGDVTAFATWDVQPSGVAVELQPGQWTFEPFARAKITATWNDQSGSESVRMGSGSEYITPPPMGVAGRDPVNLTSQTHLALGQILESSGLPIAATISSVAMTLNTQVIQASTSSQPLPAGLEAATTFAGFGSGFVFNNGPALIRVNDSIAQALLAGQFTEYSSSFGSEVPTLAVLEVVHELLHTIGDKSGIGDADDDIVGTTNPFEGMARTFVTDVFRSSHAILKRSKPMTELDRWSLGQRLGEVRRWYRRYYVEDPHDTDAIKSLKRRVRKMIDDIGYPDRDGNGLPDFIDRRLEDWGIIPEELPTVKPPATPATP